MGGHDTSSSRALAALKRQAVALLGLAMIVAGGVWAAIAMAATTKIEISTPTGTKSADIATAKEDVHQRYKVNGSRFRVDGASLQQVLSSEKIGSNEWTRIIFDGGSVTNGEKFVDKRQPVFDLDENGNVYFIIPKREGEEAQIFRKGLDFNLRGAIDIDPDEIEPEQGEKESFKATVIDGGPQKNYDFSWSASTGAAGSDRNFEITFDTSGDVEISVSAKRAGEVVAEGSIATKVMEAPDDSDGSGSGSGFDSGGSGFSTPYSPPSYSPNFPESGGSGSSDSPPAPDSEPTLDETGVSVTGELLSAVAPLSPSSGAEGSEAEDEIAAQPEPEAIADEAKEVSAPGALIAGGIIIGLLGLGAGRELESVRPRRLLRRPDFSGLRRLSPPWK